MLVVDDEAGIRDLLTLFLEDEGFSVVCAADGEQALGWLDGGLKPVVMLLDMKMPVCDGAAVLQALRERPGHPSPPVIVLSGSAELAPLLGPPDVQSVLIKPFDLDDLLRAIGAVVGISAATG